MRQGLLLSVLLVLMLVLSPFTVSAVQMDSDTVQKWLKDEHLHRKVEQFMIYVEDEDFDSLTFALERLALPQQEVARFILLDAIENQEKVLSPKFAVFLQSQLDYAPIYKVLERGDGYEFVVPAFNYPATASRLLKQRMKEQDRIEFTQAVESQSLDLKQWLSGSGYQVQTRETLLINELDNISPQAIAALTNQLTSQPVISWLPAARVMVQLAKTSQDPDVYHLLWKMKKNIHSESELTRLSTLNDAFSLSQVMQASTNPALKHQAITALTQIKPMKDEVKQFLLAKMRLAEDATLVAHELEKQGYRSWLEELLSTPNKLDTKAILQVLSN
ncbi:hypothetical protein QF117_20690 [Vibrio sp. YMD68]|uniref:hypothetical protein n=1 Tax=Vibrio sp. YMD68 TaxID=3042300 RepID=UPI00249A98CD|nr:hypothetical protein [Vibrio sp. YMD68]WGW00252.1 hypothetical protein QF117_20690 [Vibrio sp. YMD68]